MQANIFLWSILRACARKVRVALNWLFWEQRSTPLPWLIFLSASVLIGLYGPLGLNKFYSPYLHGPRGFAGIWPFIAAASAGPIAWYVFYIRDRNKATDHRLEEDRLVHDNARQAWGHFHRLEEWATGENSTLQAAAIYQLLPFFKGKPSGIIPMELLKKENHFLQPAKEILRALLNARPWSDEDFSHPPMLDKYISKDGSKPVVSPVRLAIEHVLCNVDWAGHNFSGWNLSELELENVKMKEANLTQANLQDTVLKNAILSGASLLGANLRKADFRGAKLDGANLDGALLVEATNLTRTQVCSASFDENTRFPNKSRDLKREDVCGEDVHENKWGLGESFRI